MAELTIAEIKEIMMRCNKFNIRGILDEKIEDFFDKLA